MICLKFFFKKNNKRKISIKIFVFFFILQFFFNQFIFFSYATIDDNPNYTLTANYSTNYFTDFQLGKTFVFSQFQDVIGKVVEFDDLNNGYFGGSLNIINEDESNLLLGKINDNGNPLWNIEWALEDFNNPQDLIYDNDSNRLYITGVTMNSSSNYQKTFLACFDPNDGTELWNTTLTNETNSMIPYSIDLNSEYIFVAGYITPFWNLDTNHNVFLSCFQKSNGSLIWSKTFVSADYHTQPSIVVNENNDELILIYNKRTKISNIPYYQYRIQKLDYLGNVTLEVVETAGEYIKINNAILHNESDSFILVGDFRESTDQRYKTAIILRYNFVLNKIFQLIIGENNKNEVILNVVFDSLNNLIFTGYTDSNYSNKVLAFFGKYTWGGKEVWTQKSERFYTSVLSDLAIDTNDNLLLTGYGQYVIDFLYKRLFVSYTKDSDNDLLSDFFELILGTDPLNPDTDGDDFSDGEEYLAGTDPLKACSNPKSRKFWNYFGFALAIIVIVLFILVNSIVYFTTEEDENNEQSPIIRLLNKIPKRNKKERAEQKQEKKSS
ncbi:MAG: hypothetical protein ACTSO7_01400 [Candidatus Heimdallarchaeota archaeon]